MESEKQQQQQDQDSIFISYEEFHEMCKAFKKTFDEADNIRVPVWCIYEMIRNPVDALFKYRLERIAVYDSKEDAIKKSNIFKGQILIRKEKKAANCNYYNDINCIQPTITDTLHSSVENNMMVRFFTDDKKPVWFPLRYVKANNIISSTTVFYMCEHAPGFDLDSLNVDKDIEYYFEE
jgi:hypothetical protein